MVLEADSVFVVAALALAVVDLALAAVNSVLVVEGFQNLIDSVAIKARRNGLVNSFFVSTEALKKPCITARLFCLIKTNKLG